MKVVNRHHHKGLWPVDPPHVYIGRLGKISAHEIARGAVDGTRLGNPFTLQEHGDKALELYRRDLLRKIREGGWIRDFLAEMPEDAVLVCSCKEKPGEEPRPCHGDIIVRARAWVLKEYGAPAPELEAAEGSAAGRSA